MRNIRASDSGRHPPLLVFIRSVTDNLFGVQQLRVEGAQVLINSKPYLV